MPLKHELARFVAERCAEMGIAKDRLAAIARVDPLVIENLFFPSPNSDLDVAVAEQIANAVGLSLGVLGTKRTRSETGSIVRIAAQTASTSYRDALPPDVLVATMVSGTVPPDFRSHIRALLDEGPLGLLADLAYGLEADSGMPVAQSWQTMRNLAATLGCCRDIWQ